MARDGTAVIRASDRVGQRGGGGPENREPWAWEGDAEVARATLDEA
jgi:hypothetical protein